VYEATQAEVVDVFELVTLATLALVEVEPQPVAELVTDDTLLVLVTLLTLLAELELDPQSFQLPTEVVPVTDADETELTEAVLLALAELDDQPELDAELAVEVEELAELVLLAV